MNVQRSDITVSLRIPREMHASLVEMAERDDRSLNAEIVRFLRYVIPIAQKQPI